MSSRKDQDFKILENIFFKTIEAVDPVKEIRKLKIDIPNGKTFFAAVGKGAGRLSKAFKENYKGEMDGIVVIPENEECEDLGYKVFRASHPVPSEAGFQASKALIRSASSLEENDLFVFIIAGGASSLLPFPPSGFDLEDERKLNRTLLVSGAPISVMNAFRSEFSQIKGGKLGQAAYPCPIVTLVVCDIPGDDISLVGSGPTLQRKESNLDLLNLANNYKLNLGKKVIKFFISKVENNKLSRIRKINNKDTLILSSGSMAITAAERIVKNVYGLNTICLSSSLEGDAEMLARSHASIVKEIVKFDRPIKKPAVIISGGESQINLPKNYGKGGRNSHFAMALGKEIKGLSGVTALAADTDGIDGSGSNAGAMVTGQTFEHATILKIDLYEYLEKYDSFNGHKKMGGLFFSGPTGINVNDFRAIIIR